MVTKALNYPTAEINQRLNLAGTAVQPNALNDYYTKTEVDGKVVVDLFTRYNTSYANLSAALTALNNDTSTDATAIKKGGVSIKFINSTTNKYEQWSLKASSWSIDISDWGNINVTQASEISMDGQPLDDVIPKTVNTLSSTDLDIADANGNVLARFEDGHFRTKNFDSKKTPSFSDNSDADLDIADEQGNVLVRFKGGHIKTKKFDSTKQEIGFAEYQKYNRGGAMVTNVPSTSDLKIFSTLKHIISDCPYADIILVANFYADQSIDKDAKRRVYKKELQAVTAFLSLGLIELDSLGIIRKGVPSPGIYTTDGVHAYTVAGATKIYNHIRGYLDARYNNTLESKKILILGDSSCVENPTSPSGDTSWAKMLKAALPSGNVDVRAVSGTSWLYKSNGQIDNVNNIEHQFDASNKDADIIIITAGGNELTKFQLDYEGTLKYLMYNY